MYEKKLKESYGVERFFWNVWKFVGALMTFVRVVLVFAFMTFVRVVLVFAFSACRCYSKFFNIALQFFALISLLNN